MGDSKGRGESLEMREMRLMGPSPGKKQALQNRKIRNRVCEIAEIVEIANAGCVIERCVRVRARVLGIP